MDDRPSFETDLVYALSLAGMRARDADLRQIVTRLRGPCPASTWRSALRRLQHDKFVYRHRRDGHAIVRLTLRGRVRAALPPSRSIPFPAPEGMLYFVSYDIPVALDVVRREFAEALARQGWQRVHKSLWVAGRDRRAEAMAAVEELGLQPHVRYGTCVFQEEFVPKRPRAAVVSPETLAAIERDFASGAVEAFRRWVDTTERLRRPGNVETLTPEVREKWRSVFRGLAAAVGAKQEA